MRIIIFDRLMSFTKNIVSHWQKQGHSVRTYEDFNPMFLVQGADLVFFEWLDQNIVSAVNSYQPKLPCPVVARCHSFEVFTENPLYVAWQNVDKLIFVSEYVKSFFFERFNQVSVDSTVIENGVNLDKWTFKVRSKADKPKVAIIGDMSAKKGVQMALEVISRWPEAEFFWAGPIGDLRFSTLWNKHIPKIGAGDRVHYLGAIEDVNAFLEDKDYLLSCSPWESFGYSIVEAMAKGIRPLIYNFPGAEFMYPLDCLWNSVDELFDRLSLPYESENYRRWILNKGWTEERQLQQFDELLAEFAPEKKPELTLEAK